jgi:cellulose synthase/poly-beta-1,6-N-acetylglucosamine synthase-like glycosyltransferase
MLKTVTLSIAIPAYNEEVNIKNLLVSLMTQKCNKFVLKDIIIYLDASTDGTGEIVKSLKEKYPIIKLIKGTKRKGKYFRVNQAFRKCNSDILVVLDADIALVGNNFLEKLIEKLISDPKAQMVAGHQIMVRPDNFIGKIIHTSFVLWDFVRLSIPNYDGAMNFFGAATAYRKSFVNSIHIKSSLSDPHLFIYLKANAISGFRYCRKAEILCGSIATLGDLDIFLSRSIGKNDKQLRIMFKVDLEKIYDIPLRYKFIGILKCFLWQPLYTPFALALDLFMASRANKIKVDKSPIWGETISTKITIGMNKMRNTL